jgi:hypothetical protein
MYLTISLLMAERAFLSEKTVGMGVGVSDIMVVHGIHGKGVSLCRGCTPAGLAQCRGCRHKQGCCHL